MRYILFSLISILTIECFSQNNTEYKLEDGFTISLPENFTVTDTLGQRAIIAHIENGQILILKAPNKGKIDVSIKNESELIEFYKEFQRGLLKPSKGNLLNDNFFEIGKLKANKISYRVNTSEEPELRDALIVVLNNNIYVIQFLQLESKYNDIKVVRDKFFSSIKPSQTFSIKNQLTISAESSTDIEKTAYNLGRIFGYVLIIGIFIFIVIWILKKIRK